MSVIFTDLQPYGKDALLNLATDLGFEGPAVHMKDNLDSTYGVTSPIITGVIRGKKNGKNGALKIFTKKASTDERDRRHTFVTEMFDREIYVYGVVLPKFEKLFGDYVDRDDSVLRFVKYFGARRVEGEEYLVLEDLEGYKVSDFLSQDPDRYSRSVMQWLAHFHGLSFVMKKREPELFNEWMGNLEDFTMRDTDGLKWTIFESYMSRFGLSFEHVLKDEGYTSENLEKSYTSYFREIRKNFKFYYTPKRYGVVCHGDFHIFNTLCNEDGNLRVVDYQFVRYTSPCLDLMNYLAGVYDLPTIEPLLKLYRKHLSEFVAAYGYDIEELYPKQVFEEEWRAYAPFGMMYGICGVVQASCRAGAEKPLSIVDIMSGNIPPHVWDMQTVTGGIKTFFINTFDLVRSSEVQALA